MGRGENTELPTRAPSRLEPHQQRLAGEVERARAAIRELFKQKPEWKPREIQEEACVRAGVGRGPASIAFFSMAGDNGEISVDEQFTARLITTTGGGECVAGDRRR